MLLETKNELKTAIRVIWYLYKMSFSHRHHTLLIIGCKVYNQLLIVYDVYVKTLQPIINSVWCLCENFTTNY
jgi:hypothetical protein